MSDCPYCGDDYRLELFDACFSDRWFMFDACCEGAETEARDAIASGDYDRRELAAWFKRETGVDIRGLADTGLEKRIDYGLRLDSIRYGEARDFIAAHHRHAPKAPNARGHRWSSAVYNGADLVAVAMICRPAARMIDGSTTIDVARVCVHQGRLESALARDACSMLYGSAARRAKREGYHKAITYTLASERGTTLKAAGWSIEARCKPSGGWARRPGRISNPSVDNEKKLRWSRQLVRVVDPQLSLF